VDTVSQPRVQETQQTNVDGWMMGKLMCLEQEGLVHTFPGWYGVDLGCMRMDTVITSSVMSTVSTERTGSSEYYGEYSEYSEYSEYRNEYNETVQCIQSVVGIFPNIYGCAGSLSRHPISPYPHGQ
jgi:hypothetical protein